MLKKITLSFFCIVCTGIIMAAAVNADAEQYIINGAAAHTNNFSEIGVGYEDILELPGALTIKTTANEYAVGKQPEVTYTFTVSHNGSYALSLEASQHSYPMYFSSYSVSVNGGEYININEENAGSSSLPDGGQLSEYVYLYNTNLVYELNEGVNTVAFRLDSVRLSDSRAYAYLQRIIFSSESGLISDEVPGNVFEAGQEIVFNIGIANAAYTVTGYSGEIAAAGFSEERGGEWVISPGALPCGHYMLEILGMKEYFAVVKPLAERRDNSGSPFAADCASTFIIDEEDIEGFAQTIELAGIRWIRDRIKWGVINPSEGSYDFDRYDKYIDAFARRGINITETFHSAPSYARNSGSVLPDDLMAAYSFAKEAGAHYDGRVQAWEIWNEPDISFTGSNEPADRYASVLKAMSLGFRDGSGNALISTAGFANVPGEYNDLLFSNEISSFFDIYNLHAHRNEDSSRSLWAYPLNVSAHSAFAAAYSAYDKPVWTGEAGAFMDVDDGSDISREQQKKAARYLVTSSVEGLANGENKHFWFVMPYYVENGMSLGSFSSRGTPYAAYSAAAALTDSLGSGEYYGTIPEDGVSIYCFKDGGEYAAVLWSNTAKTIELAVSGETVTITDIMGNSIICETTDGKAAVAVGEDPVYVRAQHFPGAVIAPAAAEKKERSDLPQAPERIVITQKYPSDVSENAKTDGYRLPAEGKTAVIAEIYNFNNFTVTIQPEIKTYGGWKAEGGIDSVSVPAMSCRSFTFYISAEGVPSADEKYPVVLSGSSDCGRLCRSVAYITAADDTPPVIRQTIDGFASPSSWSDGMPYGTKCTKESSVNGISFGIQFNASTGDKWCYPQLNFAAVQDFSDFNGLSVSVTADAAAAGSTFRLFLVESGGALYFTSVGYPLAEGTQILKVPWSRFVWQGGTNDTALNTESIAAIKAGINTVSAEQLTITINSMGLYGSSTQIHGSIEKAAADGEHIAAILGESAVPYTSEAAAVIINGTEYPVEYDGSLVKGITSIPDAGTYNALLRIYNESGYAVRQWFTLSSAGSIVIADESFSEAGGGVRYTAELKNGTAAERSITLYAVGYDSSGGLISVVVKSYSVAANSSAAADIVCSGENINKIKVFKWLGGTMVPIERATEYTG